MIQSILEESDGNDDELDLVRQQQNKRKGQALAHNNMTSPAQLRPARGGKKQPYDQKMGRAKHENIIAAVPKKERSFVNYGYEDHSGLETSQQSQKMSP